MALRTEKSIHTEFRKPSVPLATVSFIIPTYNAASVLGKCLSSIRNQRYPQNLIEILVVDGHSEDRSVEIAAFYGATVLKNPQRLAEKGKAIGIKAASGEIIALLDADNELGQDNWVGKMIQPLQANCEIMGVESNWLMKNEYSFANRYCCLLRLEDPISRRFAMLEKCAVKEDVGDYLIYTVKKGKYPALGANGFLWRREVFDRIEISESYDEHDFAAALFQMGMNKIANVKGFGIYHYHVNTIGDFFNKRKRQPYLFFERKKRKPIVWLDQYDRYFFYSSILYCISIVFPLVEACREYRKTGDAAWFLHPFLSFSTVAIYAYHTIKISIMEKFFSS